MEPPTSGHCTDLSTPEPRPSCKERHKSEIRKIEKQRVYLFAAAVEKMADQYGDLRKRDPLFKEHDVKSKRKKLHIH